MRSRLSHLQVTGHRAGRPARSRQLEGPVQVYTEFKGPGQVRGQWSLEHEDAFIRQ